MYPSWQSFALSSSVKQWLQWLASDKLSCFHIVSNLTSFEGAGIAQSVVCWACCPAWCSVAGLNLLWASDRGDVFLEVNMVYDSIPKTLSDESINRSLVLRVCVIHWHCSVQLSMFNMEKRYRNKIIIIIIISFCTHAFHRTDSKDPDLHDLDELMLATKTPPSMHHLRRRNVTTFMVRL